MKRQNAVETEKKAIEILQEWLNENQTDKNLSTDTTIKKCSLWCECGETNGMMAFYEGGEIATVAICEQCGDDNSFNSDVIKVN